MKTTFWILTALAATSGACGGPSGASRVCAPGATQSCACSGGGTHGVQTCSSDGTAWGSCKSCGSSQSCTPGATQSCACGGGESGTQTCLSDGSGYGSCDNCAAMCSVQTGHTCSDSSQCCPDAHGNPTQCAGLFGAGVVCTADCASNSDCVSGCCVALNGGTHVCSVAAWCRSTAGCTKSINQACTTDSDCCVDNVGSSTIMTACAGQPAVCSALCAQGSDCVSNCCAVRNSDGLRVCQPASVCGL